MKKKLKEKAYPKGNIDLIQLCVFVAPGKVEGKCYYIKLNSRRMRLSPTLPPSSPSHRECIKAVLRIFNRNTFMQTTSRGGLIYTTAVKELYPNSERWFLHNFKRSFS